MRHISPVVALSLIAFATGGCSSGKTPTDTVYDLAGDVARGKASAVWHALPTSYQDDLKQVVTMVADKLDPEIYDAGFVMAREFVQTLREKPISLADFAPGQFAMVDMERHGGVIFDLFQQLMSGDIATVEGLRNIDIPRFLDRTGGAIFDTVSSLAEERGQDVGELIAKIQIDVQSEDGDSCVLMIRAKDMPMAFPVPFQNVDGKWIPTALVAAWPGTLTEIRNSIRAMPSWKEPETRKKKLAEMKLARAQLDALKQAETVEEIRAVMRQMARPPK